MNGFLTHLRIRLRATLVDPVALAVMVTTGLATLILWPGPMPSSGPQLLFGGEPMPQPIATPYVFMWIWLWPAVASLRVGGPTAAGGAGGLLFQRGHPALPIGPRARVLAEVAVTVVCVLVVRAAALPAAPWLHDMAATARPYPGLAAFAAQFGRHTFEGLVVVLPALVVWTMPNRAPQWMFARAAGVVVLQLAAARLGLLATPALCLVTSLALVGLLLAPFGREWHSWRGLPQRPRSVAVYARRTESSRRQLVHDFIVRPLPWLAATLAAQGVVLVAGLLVWPGVRLLGEDSPGLVYFGSIVVLSFALSLIALRPMASAQAVAGLFGKPNYREGDFVTAWSTLPVRREWVLRGVYLHALLVSLFIFALALGVNLLVAVVEHHQWAVLDFERNPAARLVVPLVAAVPCVAGFVAASAAARKGKALLAGLALLVIVHGHLLMLILKVPAVLHAAMLVALALVGGVPVLFDLQRRAAPDDGVLARG
jgi:hypothetical protein